MAKAVASTAPAAKAPGAKKAKAAKGLGEVQKAIKKMDRRALKVCTPRGGGS
jgi:hypothetical protein